jgi:DNA invertase Pin-like site-specific DNA recombinase
MKIAYIRVSTKDQNEARQVNAMIEHGIDPTNFYIDKASGKDFDRTQYKALLKAARPDDVIVIKSLDRLGRNYEEIRAQFKLITERGVHINILDTPLLNTDQVLNGGLTMKFISDIILSVLGYVAEQERNNIRQRQSEGIRAARRAGKRFGRPSKLCKDFPRIAEGVQAGTITIKEACSMLGISRKTFYNHAKMKEISFNS